MDLTSLKSDRSYPDFKWFAIIALIDEWTGFVVVNVLVLSVNDPEAGFNETREVAFEGVDWPSDCFVGSAQKTRERIDSVDSANQVERLIRQLGKEIRVIDIWKASIRLLDRFNHSTFSAENIMS